MLIAFIITQLFLIFNLSFSFLIFTLPGYDPVLISLTRARALRVPVFKPFILLDTESCAAKTETK
jgi:hypothetical protein